MVQARIEAAQDGFARRGLEALKCKPNAANLDLGLHSFGTEPFAASAAFLKPSQGFQPGHRFQCLAECCKASLPSLFRLFRYPLRKKEEINSVTEVSEKMKP